MSWRGALSRLRGRSPHGGPHAGFGAPQHKVPSGWLVAVPPKAEAPAVPGPFATPMVVAPEPFSPPEPPQAAAPAPGPAPVPVVPPVALPAPVPVVVPVPVAPAVALPAPVPVAVPVPVTPVAPAPVPPMTRPPEPVAAPALPPPSAPAPAPAAVAQPEAQLPVADYVGRRRARPVLLGFGDGSQVEVEASTPVARALREVAASLVRRD